MILVKLVFWSFWFSLTRGEYAEGQFPAMGFRRTGIELRQKEQR